MSSCFTQTLFHFLKLQLSLKKKKTEGTYWGAGNLKLVEKGIFFPFHLKVAGGGGELKGEREGGRKEGQKEKGKERQLAG